MIPEPTIAVESDFDFTVRGAVLAGLAAFNAPHVGSRSASVAVAARDEAGTIVGGAIGRLYADCFFLDLLWVDEAHRRAGLGSRILRTVETEAKRLGAKSLLLDTFDFQAAPFYEKQGYIEEARLKGMVGGHDRIYMTKRPL